MGVLAHCVLWIIILVFGNSVCAGDPFDPSFLEVSEGFRTEIRRNDQELPASRRIRNSIQRAKLLSWRRRSSINNGSIARASLHEVGGAFTMQLLIGTPPQAMEVLFDTGSDLLWVQCGRSDHGMPNYFIDTSSSTFQTIGCHDARCEYIPHECGRRGGFCEYVYQYGGGSQTNGRFATETLTFATANGTSTRFQRTMFGCGDDNFGFQNLGGIAGFGRGGVSLITQLGSSIGSKFSYCLSPSTNTTSPLFYGNSARIHNPNVQSLGILSSQLTPTYYYVSLTGIIVGGSRIRIPSGAFDDSGGTIFDSGTTLTFLPGSVYDRVRSAFSSHIHFPTIDGSYLGLDLCYDTSSSGPDYSFPSLVLEFENARMSPAEENYFFAPDPTQNAAMFCLALSSSDGLGLNVIGNMMQQGHHILYDVGASTISFARVSCEEL